MTTEKYRPSNNMKIYQMPHGYTSHYKHYSIRAVRGLAHKWVHVGTGKLMLLYNKIKMYAINLKRYTRANPQIRRSFGEIDFCLQ